MLGRPRRGYLSARRGLDRPVGVPITPVGLSTVATVGPTSKTGLSTRPSSGRPYRPRPLRRSGRRDAWVKTRAHEVCPPIMPEFVVFLLSPPVEGMVVAQGALEGYRQENAALHALCLVIASPPGRGNRVCIQTVLLEASVKLA